MTGKDTSSLRDPSTKITITCSTPIWFNFRIPFTTIQLIMFRVKTDVKVEPLEGQAKPTAGMSENEARCEAALMLGVSIDDIRTGRGKKHVWLSWAGVTWNDSSWERVMRHVAKYQVKRRTEAMTDVHRHKFDQAKTDRPADHVKEINRKLNEPGGKN